MQNLKKLVIPILASTPLVLLLAQCSVGNLLPAVIGKKIWLNDDESLLQKEIRRSIPVGSSIVEAKKILQLNGFECGYHKNSEHVNSVKTDITSKDGDYLFCYLETSRLVCARTYKPFIYYKNEIVTNIDAAIGGWCL